MFKLFDRAFGLLILKVLSLGSMIGLLMQQDQLDLTIDLLNQWKQQRQGKARLQLRRY